MVIYNIGVKSALNDLKYTSSSLKGHNLYNYEPIKLNISRVAYGENRSLSDTSMRLGT